VVARSEALSPPLASTSRPVHSCASTRNTRAGGGVLRSFAIEAGALRPLPAHPASGLPPEAVWIDLVVPTPEEERALEQVIGIEIPTRAEAGGLQASDRLVAGDGALHMSALVAAGPPAGPALVPLTFVLAGERLVTVRYNAVEALDPFVARHGTGQGKLAGAGDLLAALLETIVDHIADKLEKVGEALDRLGRGVFRHPAAVARRAGRRAPIGRRIGRLEAVIEDIGSEHELAARLRQSLQSLIRLVAFCGVHADDGLRRRLKAIETDLHSLAEHNAYLATDMEFMLDATVGLIDIQQNKVIYILSIVGVALTPPVLVASIYGMNFHHMPELDWPLGYLWGLGLMLASAVGPFLFFKLRGWL
jgi:magnesium transporter